MIPRPKLHALSLGVGALQLEGEKDKTSSHRQAFDSRMSPAISTKNTWQVNDM